MLTSWLKGHGLRGSASGLIASGLGSMFAFWMIILGSQGLPSLSEFCYLSGTAGFCGNIMGLPLAIMLGFRASDRKEWVWGVGIAICFCWGLLCSCVVILSG